MFTTVTVILCRMEGVLSQFEVCYISFMFRVSLFPLDNFMSILSFRESNSLYKCMSLRSTVKRNLNKLDLNSGQES